MSESEVTQIRDEDLLRRMWQQTDDFSRKKEIRSHMYRLREERLRDLYSTDSSDGKGCEFTSGQGHVKSFADQTFQSMKSKEVRDAGSPPKEFTYRGQDLKELSNAGWNVESENRTTDDGRTHVKSVNANIEGKYDVDGGRGQFAAIDRQRQAVTEYEDANSSLRRDETSADTTAREHIVQQTDDGTCISSTTTSSNTSSKIQQVSSTKHETVPHVTDDDYDLTRYASQDTNRDGVTRITKRNETETTRRTDFSEAELISRKVEYPDNNTKVIVETRCLPDGTRVTSTRQEFRAPAQSTRSESYQTSSESKSFSSQHKSDTRDSSTRITRRTVDDRSNDIVDSQRNVDDSDFKKQIREYTVRDNDEYSDNQQQYVTKTDRKATDRSLIKDQYSQSHHETRTDKNVIDHSTTNKQDTQTQRRVVDQINDNRLDEIDCRNITSTRDNNVERNVIQEIHQTHNTKEKIRNMSMDRKETAMKIDNIATMEKEMKDIKETHNIPRKANAPYGKIPDTPRDKYDNVPRDRDDIKVTHQHNTPIDREKPYDHDIPKDNVHASEISKDKKISEEYIHDITRDTKVEKMVEKKSTNENYQTTYQSDFQTRKVSTDWSPTHQAWASTLRSDTPSTTRPSTRASSPGSRTFKSSTSSLRSSVSPDKVSRKPSSRGASPNKLDRYSPSRTITSERYSSTHSTQSVNEIRTNKNISPERKPPTGRSPGRPGYSPDRKPQDVNRQRPSTSPDKRPSNYDERTYTSPERKASQKFTIEEKLKLQSYTTKGDTSVRQASADKARQSPERKPINQLSDDDYSQVTPPFRSTTSPQRPQLYDYPHHSSPRSSPSPDRKPSYKPSYEHPNRTVSRSTPSPDRKHLQQKPTDQQMDNYPNRPKSKSPIHYRKPDTKEKSKDRDDLPYNPTTVRPDLSPERKPGYDKPKDSLIAEHPRASSPSKITKTSEKTPDRTELPRSNFNPVTDIENDEPETDRDQLITNKPHGYMRPTAASQPDFRGKIKPTDKVDKTSPTMQIPDVNKDTIKIKEQHNRFVDEETKFYTQVNNNDEVSNIVTSNNFLPSDKSTIVISERPVKDSPDFCTSPDKDNKKLLHKEPVINSENMDLYGKVEKTVNTIDTTIKRDKQTEDITSIKQTPGRETSPSKYGTYDKKKQRSDIKISEETSVTAVKTNDFNDVSLNRRTAVSDQPLSPIKKNPRNSTSPTKSPIKDSKYQQTTDFLATEKNTEDFHKTTSTKHHHRQLITPSSSPTRKSKNAETEPSTGQSSPTTSVSGFVYFGSPRTETPEVTDLDELYPNSEKPDTTQIKRPETLDMKTTLSPSKIPCRSPSPEKHTPVMKDILPRKSSLKKPLMDVTTNQVSPIEKPPTNFRVSPTDETPVLMEPNIVKKDYPHEPETGELKSREPNPTSKPKPPLQRRETYEDRCKKILGMVDDTSTTDVKSKETTRRYTKKVTSNLSSPSLSPCDSPVPKDPSPSPDYQIKNKNVDTKVDITDFISREQEHVINTTATPGKKSKTPSRECSPTKQQDVTRKTTSIKNKSKKESIDTETISKTKMNQYPSYRQSPDKFLNKSFETDRNLPEGGLKKAKSVNKSPKETSPDRKSPDKQHEHHKTTQSITSEYETTLTSDSDTTYVTKTVDKSQPTRVLESSTRQNPVVTQNSPQRLTVHQRTPSPPKSYPKQESFTRENIINKPTSNISTPEFSLPSGKVPNKSGEATENIPRYMKSTTSVSSKLISTTTEVLKESHTSKTEFEKVPDDSAISPTRKVSQGTSPRSPSPTNHPRTSGSLPKRSDSSPQRKPLRDTIAKQPKFTSEHSRTPSPTKQTRPVDNSPERKTKRRNESSPTRPGFLKTSGISATTVTSTSESNKLTTIDKGQKNLPRDSILSTREIFESSPEYLRKSSPDRKREHASKIDSIEKAGDKDSQSPNSPSPVKTPGYMKTTTSTAYKFDTISNKNIEFDLATKKTTSPHSDLPSETNSKTKGHPSTLLPSPSTNKLTRISSTSPERKVILSSENVELIPESKKPKDFTSIRSSISPDRPSYMKPTASIISKHATISSTAEDIQQSLLFEQNRKSPNKSQKSPTRETLEREHLSKPEQPRELRTPSPTKKTTIITEVNIDFLSSEREQEILNKVQKSLRKLSPDRKEKSPSRERSPTKSTTSLQDLDIITSEMIEPNKDLSGITEEQITIISEVTRSEKSKPHFEHKIPSKPSSRNVSPTKKVSPNTPYKVDNISESPTKTRSISPKKPISQVERPRSPQVPKSSVIKSREQIPHLTRKATPATLSTVKIERLTTDVKKTNGVTKQNTLNKPTTSKTVTKSSPTGKFSEAESKHLSTPKGVKEVSPKKDAVTRTTSDIIMKPKKTASPQRMRSKPEIQVSDLSTKSSKSQKPRIKEPHINLPNKPKSATALNTSTDEDDIIIDLQQSKSSRENSPDRIFPTPINFSDDVGTPRFPDEVSEPDDDFVKRTHHTILETETLVDDIVEICEDEELFVKKTKKDTIYEGDDSLLSVNDKVNKFTNKIHSVGKPQSTKSFKDTERRVHSDFVEENLKSDECLLTVSEKVNKFAKGPKNIKDNISPSRKITDEYDRNTIYQDDYTKLSVNDKAHLFVESAESVMVTKVKPAQKVERPDLSNVDESLKSDDCLLSVSDKVSKFVKTAENFLTETHIAEDADLKIKEHHQKIIKQMVLDDDDDQDETFERHEIFKPAKLDDKRQDHTENKPSIHSKVKDNSNLKATERVPTVKITTLRSSEAVKKAKALFENIASTEKIKETTYTTKPNTKLTDIGVIKNLPKTDSTTVLNPLSEDVTPHDIMELDREVDAPLTSKSHPTSRSVTKPQHTRIEEKSRSSPKPLIVESPEPRSKSPIHRTVEVTTTKTVLSRYPASIRGESPRNRPKSPIQRTESPNQRTESPRQRTESPRQRTESPRQRTESPRQRPESEKVPGYLRPTKTSQIKEEPKIVEEPEVSSRRGSGKFGVELRRTSVERSTVSSERRRSVDHHQPCIEDIFELDLLEQMLEKVMGYEQRRRIRAQIRVAKNLSEHVETTHTKTTKTTTTASKTRSPERKIAKSPERIPKSASHKTSSPERLNRTTPNKTYPDKSHLNESTSPEVNGHAKEPAKIQTTRQRPRSPDKPAPKSTLALKTPIRQPSPDKRRPASPSKATPKPKSNRFSEYASAYMKKVGLSDSDKIKFSETQTKKTTNSKQRIKHEKEETVQEFTTTKSLSERTSSKNVIEIVQLNGKRSQSPEKKVSPERKVKISDRNVQSPERKAHSPARKVDSPERLGQSPDRIYQRTPSPEFKRPKADAVKETIIKSVYDIEKKMPSSPVQNEKPSWVTNRNLKKITTESRTYSSKKIESEKPKYRAASPSKVITKPIDVITSSYGPGPLDSDGRPLFGIKALRNGGTNFQVKGTVIRQEFHSHNGSVPEGTVSVTAYSSQPEDLELLLAAQGANPPSRLHGLSAITTTKKFGGDTGHSLSNVHTKEERASLEQFTHTARKVDSRVENLETRTHDYMQDVSSTRRVHSRTDDRSDRTDSVIDRTDRIKTDKTEVKRGKVEERRVEKREDKKTVRQSSVKSLTEKYIKSANESGKSERASYPKAGLILRTTSMRDSVSSDDAHPGLTRTDSEHSLEDTVVTTERTGHGVRTTTTRTTHHPPTYTQTRAQEPIITKKTSTIITQEPIITKKTTYITQEPVTHRVIGHEPTITHKVVHEPVKVTQSRGATTVTTEKSFLDSNSKVTGVQDILTRMKNADIVIQEGDSTEDSEARALLNKFLGATVLMAGMQGYVNEQDGRVTTSMTQETVSSRGSGEKVTSVSLQDFDPDHCWDEGLLKKLLEECTDYEQRRRLRARIRTLMAEQEACASAVTEALGVGGATEEGDSAHEEEEVTVTSSVRRDSSDKTVSSSTTTTKTSKVIEMTRSAPKPVSPFAKFRQLEKQNSTNSPKM